jgi:hypothetical protein
VEIELSAGRRIARRPWLPRLADGRIFRRSRIGVAHRRIGRIAQRRLDRLAPPWRILFRRLLPVAGGVPGRYG